jgi:hypothetical protein
VVVLIYRTAEPTGHASSKLQASPRLPIPLVMDVWWGLIGVGYAAWGAYVISSPERRERYAQNGAGFHQRWLNFPGNFGTDVGMWRRLIPLMGIMFILVGLLTAADEFFGLDIFS